MADMIMADKATRGVYLNREAKNRSVSAMQIAITMFDIAVLHPALKFTAVFENGPS